MNGIIVIDKPQGMTSHDVVSVLRMKTGVRQIGHTGTLDPMATGVLPVFIGKATRLIEYASRPGDQEAKVYLCTMKLGVETDTQDIWGEPTGNPFSGRLPGVSEIERVLKSFEGAGKQIPPMYSAVKINGRKLYEYAREGEEPEEGLIKERDVYIKHIYVNDMDEEAGLVSFEVCCSKGVYIRTLCADTGWLLGCGAVMSGLRRLRSDGFGIEQAVQIDMENDGLPELMPMDAGLGWMERIDLSEDEAADFSHGMRIEGVREVRILPGADGGGVVYKIYGPEDCFAGIGKITGDGGLKAVKVLV